MERLQGSSDPSFLQGTRPPAKEWPPFVHAIRIRIVRIPPPQPAAAPRAPRAPPHPRQTAVKPPRITWSNPRQNPRITPVKSPTRRIPAPAPPRAHTLRPPLAAARSQGHTPSPSLPTARRKDVRFRRRKDVCRAEAEAAGG
ncbi:hypothetical protein B0H12DRAFT_219990 [Mycena haematopus]|nr:hypothetical protein B0H12DRAFT_219990 [Mycena haematopus]